ncbi:glycosyltransferase family 2 protein [Mesorhizobium sp. 10J20-29]
MKISAITVCWNSEATIRHTIDSFLSQDHSDKEMVLIDGASKDHTVEIARSYDSDQITIISEPDRGMYDALNKGLKLFTGDAFGVLNSDDTYHDRSVLGRVAEALEKADVVHGHLDFVNNHISKNVVRRWRSEPRPEKGFRTGWMPAHPTFYARREVAERVGEFDLSLKTASDYDWMLRAVELSGFRIAEVNHVMIDMQRGGKSTSGLKSHIAHNLEALRARQKWLNAGWFDLALVAKPARKLGQFVRFGSGS